MHTADWLYGVFFLALAPGALAGESAASRTPVDLSGGLAPLKSEFNAAAGQPRFLAVVSPTCPACRHGVNVIRDVILTRGPTPPFRLFVVWTPMLSTDDEPALKSMASKFGDARTVNFLDPERHVGKLLRSDLFATARADMLGVLPADHFFREYAEAMPADRPEWDIYLAFGPDARWNEVPPKPLGWVRQTARYQTTDDGPLVSLMWINDYATPPVEGQLAEAVGRLADIALAGAKTAGRSE